MDLLRDPIWGFISVVVAVLIFFGGTWVVLWQRNRKALSYEVVSDVPVVTVRRDAKNPVAEAIQILYNGQPIKDVQQVVIRIWNSGNIAIRPDDYATVDGIVKSIEVSFSGQMLAYDVIDTAPAMDRQKLLLGGGTGPERSSMQFRPMLLNSKDSITVQALLTNYTGKVAVSARIADVSTIRAVTRGQLSRGMAVFAVVSSVIGVLLILAGQALPVAIEWLVFGLAGVFFGMALAAVLPYLRALPARWSQTRT